MIKIISENALDLAEHIRPGDMVTWGQASGEPLTLVDKLLEQRAAIGKIKAFVGLSLTGNIKPEHADFISCVSYGALGSNAKLAAAGALELVPCHYSSVPTLIRQGQLPIDVVLVQISPPGPDGSHSLGFCNDYLPNAMRRARLVIAEINENVPWSHMETPLEVDRIDFAIVTDRETASMQVPEPREVEEKIARNVASVVEDGTTLQWGVGSIPSALLKAMSGHRRMGVHSGLITEDLIDLVECGAVTNENKGIHRGISVGAIAIGGPRLRDFMHDNPAFQIHESTVTHGTPTLGQIDNLIALNSALEVDLFGQINAEQVGDRYLGAIGGQVDFMHAATVAANGLSIIAMPASLGKSGASRITTRLNGPFVTTCRTDVDMVITEFGIADLRGKTVDQRALSLIEIALPDHRDQLKHSFLKAN